MFDTLANERKLCRLLTSSVFRVIFRLFSFQKRNGLDLNGNDVSFLQVGIAVRIIELYFQFGS